jgi:hypothetical protein
MDRWYGLREFGLVDADGTFLRVGSWLRRPGDDQSERGSVIP